MLMGTIKIKDGAFYLFKVAFRIFSYFFSPVRGYHLLIFFCYISITIFCFSGTIQRY
ncbi:hypothetical protein KP509_38G048200 [Ceratopteris richardii]|uniref:Uncharacterized protein n=1 Tax=Ceratopteris richardii TaxID=49495 RepID=A0A8T2Q3T9_CERRI|nr:hypothetical protein KP509_38G048200 [Ceratopteris richardii]